MLPTHLLVGLVAGMALFRHPRLLGWAVVAGGVSWAVGLAIVTTASRSGFDLVARPLAVGILSVANLGLGALVGLYLVRKIRGERTGRTPGPRHIRPIP